MFKKIILTTLLYLSLFSMVQAEGFSISDANVKKWVIEGNKAEQCLFPNLKNHQPLSEVEMILHKKYVHDLTLITVIGLDNVNKIFSHQPSFNLMMKKFQRFNHSKPANFSLDWCTDLQMEYAKELPIAQNWLAQQKEQQQKAAEQAFYASPQGQAFLAQQQIIQQQQQILEQQRIQQERQATRQAWQDLGNTIQQSAQNISNMMNNTTQMINNMSQQMRVNNPMMLPNWTPNRRGSITCYQLGTDITRCNY